MFLGAIPSSKIFKKGVQTKPKFKCGPGTQEGHSALPKCRLALPKCRLAQTFGSAQEPPD